MKESCYLKGVQGLAPASSAARRMHNRTGGAHTRRGTHKAGNTQGGALKRRSKAVQESCFLRGVRGLVPASSAASRMHSRTGGGPEEVSRGIPYTPWGGGTDRGGGELS